jgi:membrane protein implicated in regulation of membrane protease activity
VSFFNMATASAFLAWFGGVGFLLTRYSTVWAWFGVAIAVTAGLAGASVVFWFVAKVLVASERNLDPADYEMVGALGRVSSTIREGGVGEMLFAQQGSRKSAPARSETGAAIAKNTEVVVTRYEKGIAYVRPWDEMTEGS